MAKEKKIEPIEEQVVEEIEETEKVDDTERFIINQLVAINRMSNKARARRLAARVLSNRKG